LEGSLWIAAGTGNARRRRGGAVRTRLKWGKGRRKKGRAPISTERERSQGVPYEKGEGVMHASIVRSTLKEQGEEK